MEILALLHAFVACEDPRKTPKLRSLQELNPSFHGPTIMLEVAGCVMAVFMLTATNVQVAVQRGDVCPTVQALQQFLIREGHDPGPVNGDFGGKTEYAVMHFQQAQGLIPSRAVDAATATALGMSVDAACGGSTGNEAGATSTTTIAALDAQSDVQPNAQPSDIRPQHVEPQPELPNFGSTSTPSEPAVSGAVTRSVTANRVQLKSDNSMVAQYSIDRTGIGRGNVVSDPERFSIAPPTSSGQKEQVQTTRLVLKRSERRVYAYQGKQELASFPVAVGKPGWETPVGTFQVRTMARNPGWTHPFTGEVMPPESNNPLGERWIEFWTDGHNSIGFHGTPNRASVGRAASHGCVRMYNEDIEKLYEWVSEGTPVIVEQ